MESLPSVNCLRIKEISFKIVNNIITKASLWPYAQICIHTNLSPDRLIIQRLRTEMFDIKIIDLYYPRHHLASF